MTAVQLFQRAWISQENITLSSTLVSGCVTQPGPDLPGSLTHGLAAAATASHHSSLQPVSTAAREPSKGENRTSSISVTRCRFFSDPDPREQEEMIQNILEEKHHCRMGHSVYLLFVSGNNGLNSFIPEEQSVWWSLSKTVKSRLVWSVLVSVHCQGHEGLDSPWMFTYRLFMESQSKVFTGSPGFRSSVPLCMWRVSLTTPSRGTFSCGLIHSDPTEQATQNTEDFCVCRIQEWLRKVKQPGTSTTIQSDPRVEQCLLQPRIFEH